jgi:hypothetical protein
MLIPAQNSNKANYKIQDRFANRQIKEDVKCNNRQIKDYYFGSILNSLSYTRCIY